MVERLAATRAASLYRRVDEFGPVFKMHGVAVIPFAAPDKSMVLEDLYDRGRNSVLPGLEIAGQFYKWPVFRAIGISDQLGLRFYGGQFIAL
jgi:hypothetical protein